MTAGNVRPLHPARPHVPGHPGWEYQREPGLVLKEGSTVLEWCPIVRARLVTTRPDGTPDGRYYRLVIGADEIVASHKEIRTGEVWDRAPDAYGTDSRTMRDVMTAIITDQARREARTIAVTRTGWHPTPEGGRMYVYPDGRAWPADASVELVGAPERLTAAAAPVPPVDDTAVRTALAEITEHGGWAPLLGIAAGARSVGQTLRPIPAALVLHGDPHSGKSSVAAAGRMLTLAPSWPPLATAKMSEDTVTTIEARIDLEADMPTLLDDLALTADASAIAQRDAITKLERIIRAVGNGGEMRGRANRDGLTMQTPRHIRTIPVITAQQLPAGMQASLYRRAVVVRLEPGVDVDVRWWKSQHTTGHLEGAIGPALRTIGNRIVERFGTVEDPAALLATAERTALETLGRHIDRELPGWADSVDGMAGVVEAAAAMLSGLVLVADAAGVDAEQLLETAAGPLARALAVQADAMDDRRRATDDLSTAIGDIVRHALMTRRAHIASSTGELGPGYGPGWLTTPQELGLREAGRDANGLLPVYEAYGPTMYWLPDRGDLGALAVRASAVYDVIRANGDPRAAGHTALSISKALGRAGALIRGREKDHPWRVKVRLPGAPEPDRMLLLRPDVVWPDLRDPAGPPDDGREAAPAPAPPGPEQNPAPEPLAPEPPAPVVDPPAVADDAGASTPAETGPPAPEPADVLPGPAGPVLAAGVDVDGLYLPDGTALPHEIADLPGLLAAVLEAMPDGGTVAIDGELAERIGYPDRPVNTGLARAHAAKRKSKTVKTAQECRAIVDGRTAGWQCSAAGVGAWTAWHGDDGRAGVVVLVLPWLAQRLRVNGARYLTAEDHPIAAAYLLGRYRELTGVPYTMTAGTSGINMIRAEFTGRAPSKGRRRRPPRLKWDGHGTPAEAIQEKACSWSRDLTADERAMGHVIGYDARMAYLSAESLALLAVDTLEHTGLPAGGFDKNMAGYWQVSTKWAPYELLPALTPAGPGPHPLTTPTVALLLETDMPEEAITDAWLCTRPNSSARLLRPVSERLRDGIMAVPADTPDVDEKRVRDALKATYPELYGLLALGTPYVHRRDWSDAIVATARTTLLRKVIKIGETTGRWPIKIDTDSVFYTCATPDAERELPPGWKLDTGAGSPLGKWEAKHIMTMAEYLGEE